MKSVHKQYITPGASISIRGTMPLVKPYRVTLEVLDHDLLQKISRSFLSYLRTSSLTVDELTWRPSTLSISIATLLAVGLAVACWFNENIDVRMIRWIKNRLVNE